MKMLPVTRRLVLVGLALAAATSFGPMPAFAQKTAVKIGFIGPLSGGNAGQGLGARNGFQLALDQANADPDGQYEFEGVVLDDASDPQTGVSAAMKLVNDPEVAAVTGHWNSPVALATMPVFSRFQVPLVVWGAISPKITDQNLPEVTRVTPTLLTENKPLAEEAVATLGAKRIAIIADSSDYGSANSQAFTEFAEAAGAQIVSTDLLPVGSTDFRTVLTSVKAENVDAIYFGGVITEGGILARQMKEQSMDTPLLAISGVYDPEFIKVAGDAADLAVVSYPTAATNAVLEKLNADYEAEGFAEPTSPYTKYAFDAANAIIAAIEKVGVEDKAALAQAIRATNLEGASGTVTFDENGQTQVPVEITLRTVRNGAWTDYTGN